MVQPAPPQVTVDPPLTDVVYPLTLESVRTVVPVVRVRVMPPPEDNVYELFAPIVIRPVAFALLHAPAVLKIKVNVPDKVVAELKVELQPPKDQVDVDPAQADASDTKVPQLAA